MLKQFGLITFILFLNAYKKKKKTVSFLFLSLVLWLQLLPVLHFSSLFWKTFIKCIIVCCVSQNSPE